jgi:hypothetical protein
MMNATEHEPEWEILTNIDEPADFMPKKNRITKVIVKGELELLLLNIKPENYDRFLQAANTFRVLPGKN